MNGVAPRGSVMKPAGCVILGTRSPTSIAIVRGPVSGRPATSVSAESSEMMRVLRGVRFMRSVTAVETGSENGMTSAVASSTWIAVRASARLTGDVNDRVTDPDAAQSEGTAQPNQAYANAGAAVMRYLISVASSESSDGITTTPSQPSGTRDTGASSTTRAMARAIESEPGE